MFEIFLTVLFILVSIAIVVVVVLQEPKTNGLMGAIGGQTETYWSKNKGRSREGALAKATRYLGIAFILIALLLFAVK